MQNEILSHVYQFLIAGFTLLLAIVGFFLRYFLKKNDDAISALKAKDELQDKRMNEIETNYKERFFSLERSISHSQLQVQDSIAKLGIKIEHEFADMKVCVAKQQGEIDMIKDRIS